MTGAPEAETNGRVTIREVYDLQFKILDKITDLERRLTEKYDKKIDDVDERINDMETRYNWWSGANSALALIGSTLAAMLSKRP